MTALTFTVVGIAQPKGSTRMVPIRREIRSLRDVRVTSDNPQVKTWQGAVAKAAWVAKQELEATARGTLEGPVALQVEFYLYRPSGLPKSYHGPHLTKPDLDKLVRAVKDALTSVVWRDDSQVTCLIAGKAYAGLGEEPRTVITVRPVDPPLLATQERTGTV
jgi:Holliday junction resolvase RusA-like endonuclease